MAGGVVFNAFICKLHFIRHLLIESMLHFITLLLETDSLIQPHLLHQALIHSIPLVRKVCFIT